MKIVMVRLEIDEAELAQAHELYAEEHGHTAPSDIAAIARDIQMYCYDDGAMHGTFEVLSVTEAAQ